MAKSDCSTFGVADTLIGSPLRWAPLPRAAVKVSFNLGALTTPAITLPWCSMPMETAKKGLVWAKFVVPSMGSMIQR